MPNYSNSSVMTFDWPMIYNDCSPVKKRNLLENLQIPSETNSSTPAPPPFQDFVTLNQGRRTSEGRSSFSSVTSSDAIHPLPHQIPSPLLDRQNYKYSKIRARPIYNFKYNESSIWTQSTSNPIDSLLSDDSFDAKVMNKFFAKENKIGNDSIPSRSRSSSISTTNSTSLARPYQYLDKSAQISYDVTMRHLLQLLNKVPEGNATIDDVLNGIENGMIPNEWLQCVQRLISILHKQFEKRPDDKQRLKNVRFDDFETLNLVEQFFVKLIRLPNYEFKLKSYQYRDELQGQLVLLRQSIDRLFDGIELVLNHQYLPCSFQILCYLYNLVSNKSVPGLDLISIEDALNSPTNRSSKTVAHVLAQILEDYYPECLANIIDDQKLIELKKLSSIKYEKLYLEIREIYRQYEELRIEFDQIRKSNPSSLPSFIEPMLYESQQEFERIFQREVFIQRGERNLAAYFCSNDLSLEICLSTVGHFIDKINLAYNENHHEKLRKYKHV